MLSKFTASLALFAMSVKAIEAEAEAEFWNVHGASNIYDNMLGYLSNDLISMVDSHGKKYMGGYGKDYY